MKKSALIIEFLNGDKLATQTNYVYLGEIATKIKEDGGISIDNIWYFDHAIKGIMLIPFNVSLHQI